MAKINGMNQEKTCLLIKSHNKCYAIRELISVFSQMITKCSVLSIFRTATYNMFNEIKFLGIGWVHQAAKTI